MAQPLAAGIGDDEHLLPFADGKAAPEDGLDGAIEVWGHALAGYRWVVREVSLWLDEPYEPRPALDGDLACEVCIVGAGIGGLAAAWHLSERGVRDIAVLERGVVAGGASGRSGGFFIAGAAPMYDRARELWGRERARAIYAATRSEERRGGKEGRCRWAPYECKRKTGS